MDKEFFDIVDEHNNPIEEIALRSEAHSKGLWHRTVHLYIFRERDGQYEFLVHLRSKTKDLCPNRWDTRFGGHVKSGETLDEAIVNEIREELGLDIRNATLLKGETRKHEDFPNNEFVTPFYLEVEKQPELNFNDGEVQKVQWMTQQEIIESKSKNPEQWSGSLKGFQARCEEIRGLKIKV